MTDKVNNPGGCSCCSDCADTEQDANVLETGGCCRGPGCCDQPKADKKNIVIDFLYLDLSICSRCQGTDTTLDAALLDVAKVLEATGVEVVVNKVNVLNEDLAREYKFVSSPTIRINGRDIQGEVRESTCESCGDLCGDSVDCRVWVYHGKEYTEPPKTMIIEAILKEVYGPGNDEPIKKEYVLPENLRQFYAAMDRKSGAADSCC